MSYFSLVVLVPPNNNIAMCFSQSECNLRSLLLGVSAATEANLILIKVLSKSNQKPSQPSMQAHKNVQIWTCRAAPGEACCGAITELPLQLGKSGEDSH